MNVINIKKINEQFVNKQVNKYNIAKVWQERNDFM